MSPYEIIIVVTSIISAVLSALTIGYKLGQKSNRLASNASGYS